MALTGGTVLNPHTGKRVSWRPAAGVADDVTYIDGRAGYVFLGALGNRAHLELWGGHTPWCNEGGALAGYVYAIDCRIPNQAGFEEWLLAQLRAGRYPEVYYFNINNRHWSRNAVRGGKVFGYSVYSADDHFHKSLRGGYERTRSTMFADWDRHRGGASGPVEAAHNWFDAAAAGLPVVRSGTSAPQKVVRMVQGLLTANGQVTGMDGVVGNQTITAIRAFQSAQKMTVDGICGSKTWQALVPADPATVKTGTSGWTVRVFQALLLAQGYRSIDGNPVLISGTADELTIEAMRRFQVDRKVANSVVDGRGDGIGGQRTWLALLAV